MIRPLVGTAVYLATIALFSYALGALLRHSAAALATVLGLLLVAPILFSAIPWKPLQQANPFLPGRGRPAVHADRPSSSRQRPRSATSAST